MPFTVETGTGVAGANAYIDVDFYNTYWTDRPQGSNGFTGAQLIDDFEDEAKQAGILYVTSDFEALWAWSGNRVTPATQGLGFPRSGILYGIDAVGGLIKDNEVPLDVKWACAEQTALVLAVQPINVVLDPEAALKQLDAGPVTLIWDRENSPQDLIEAEHVQRLLANVGSIRGENMAWVVRA